MAKSTQTRKQIDEQLDAHGIQFGEKYRDPASGFEGFVKGMHFYEHACLRVSLRGVNKTTGEPAEYSFDAPELVAVADDKPVPSSSRTGGPHGLKEGVRAEPGGRL